MEAALQGVGNTERMAYSIAEACAITSLGRSKVYSLIAEGRLVTCKVGKRTLVLAKSLSGLIDPAPGVAPG